MPLHNPMNDSRWISIGIGLIACLLAAWSPLSCSTAPLSQADVEHVTKSHIMTSQDGHAIGGYDPVSYFLDAGPRKGAPEFFYLWRDARWLFASSAHRELFVQDPSQYAPVYGGWCAFGVAEGYPAESDPANAWTIHQGKLYLNWDAEVAREWRLEIEALLAKSEANWPDVRQGLQDGTAKIYWHDDE